MSAADSASSGVAAAPISEAPAATNAPDVRLTGVWKEDRARSDSLDPLLKHLGLNWLMRKAALSLDVTVHLQVLNDLFLISEKSNLGASITVFKTDNEMRKSAEINGKETRGRARVIEENHGVFIFNILPDTTDTTTDARYFEEETGQLCMHTCLLDGNGELKCEVRRYFNCIGDVPSIPYSDAQPADELLQLLNKYLQTGSQDPGTAVSLETPAANLANLPLKQQNDGTEKHTDNSAPLETAAADAKGQTAADAPAMMSQRADSTSDSRGDAIPLQWFLQQPTDSALLARLSVPGQRSGNAVDSNSKTQRTDPADHTSILLPQSVPIQFTRKWTYVLVGILLCYTVFVILQSVAADENANTWLIAVKALLGIEAAGLVLWCQCCKQRRNASKLAR